MRNNKQRSYAKPAVVLLSGGLDSATTLYLAKKEGFNPACLVFDYGQRHQREIKAAMKVARAADAQMRIIKIALPWKGSSLLDKNIEIEKVTRHLPVRQAGKSQDTGTIPSTYVPARNIIFLSFALSYAEAIGAGSIFIGAHAQDYSGYPDCRPEFFRAFEKVIKTGLKTGTEGKQINILAPLLFMTKARIIKLGMSLGVPYALTWSCYRGGRYPCGKCDSCYFRAKGFKEVGSKDPLKDK